LQLSIFSPSIVLPNPPEILPNISSNNTLYQPLKLQKLLQMSPTKHWNSTHQPTNTPPIDEFKTQEKIAKPI
jgi:hypothetical protein